jgi:Metallo-peptidase family M12
MICRRLICAVPCLCCSFWSATGPALAQTEATPTQLVMSKLPPQDSAAYKAIKRIAGKATSQVLTLTKTEMWSVPKENVEAVKKAAARLGVSVSQIGANWNQVFRSAPMDVIMSGKQKIMIELAKASKATIGVGMVTTSFPPVVEYALTNEATGQTPAANATTISVALNDKTVLMITRTSVDVRAHMCIWRGTVDGTGAPATLMWWPGGKMTGTVEHEGRIFSIRAMGGDRHAIVEMGEDRMPQEHAPMSERMRVDAPNLHDDPLMQQGDASVLRSATAGLRPPPAPALHSPGSEKQKQPDATASSNRASAPMVGKAGGSPDEVVIDVLVAYTRKAARNYVDVEHELVYLAIEEANQAFRNSNIGHVKLRLVHTYQTDYVEEGTHFDHVWRFADKGDGYMDEVHGLRDKYRADVAMLIVDDPSGCGLATRVFADAQEAFAVVHHECAAASYSLAHEVGHLIGARHDLKLDKTMTPFPYGHGFVNGTKWRDIMSYKDSCGGCPRLPVWSSPNVTVNGEPAGTPYQDNARVIAEQAARVARFR